MLKIAFFNCNGLSIAKLQTLRTLLLTSYDVMFLAETWHLQNEHLAQDPLLLVKSPLYHPRLNMRQKNGICALVNPRVRQSIKILSSREHVISITINEHPIHCVYFPPLMSPILVKDELNRIQGHCTVVGDFNIRLGGIVSDTVTGPPDRVELVTKWAQLNQLSLIPPQNGCSRNDHLFTRLQATCTLQPKPVPSDHDVLLDIQLDIKVLPDAEWWKPTTRRFYIRKLNEKSNQTKLQRCYNETSQELSDLLDYHIDHLPLLRTLSDRQTLVDEMDAIIHSNIHQCCESILGSYPVKSVKNNQDANLLAVQEAGSHVQAVMAFRRSCLENAPVLSSSNPELSVMDDVKQHFASVFAPPSVEPTTMTGYWNQEAADCFDPRMKLSISTMEMLGVGDPSLSNHMLPFDIIAIIRKYDISKACGIDSIHTKILRALCQSSFPFHLSRLFKLCCLTGLTPTRWNESLVYTLPKKKDSYTIQECRPISLTLMFRRIFEAALLRFIKRDPITKSRFTLNHSQAGFRHGHSTTLNAMLTNDYSYLPNYTTHRLFVDFKQAYDRVPIDLLMKKLDKRRVPAVIKSFILSLFSNTRMVVVVNGDLSETIPLFRGLLQGSLLSPLLFNIFIDDLADQLNLDSSQPCPLFADDLLCISNSITHLQSQADLISIWCVENGMAVGINKCGYIGPSSIPIYLQEQEVPIVQVYKYLGFPHTRLGIDLLAHFEAMLLKARGVFKFCQRVGIGWPQWIKLSIFKTFIRSRLEYGAPLLWLTRHAHQNIIQQLDLFTKECIKWIIAFASSTSQSAVVLSVPLASTRLNGLAANLVHHYNAMPEDHLIHHLVRRIGPGPWREGVLSPRVPLSTLYRELNNRARLQWTKFSTELKKFYLETVSSASRIGPSIKNTARSQLYGYDRVLLFRDPEIRSMALAWRVGSFHWNRQCPHTAQGSHRFTRACIKRRHLVLPLEYRTLHLEYRPHPNYPFYCPVDSILNALDEENAAGVLKWLHQQLASRPETVHQQETSDQE